MQTILRLARGGALLAVLPLTTPSQGPPCTPHYRYEQMSARGALGMGFDQDRTRHRFLLGPDGGTIEVTVRDAADGEDLAAIRRHLPHIASMFAAGDFSIPHFVHGEQVPGTPDLTRLRDRIRYRYEEIPGGGRVRISTADREARAAIHAFLRYQIQDHHTGDSLQVTSPGEESAAP